MRLFVAAATRGAVLAGGCLLVAPRLPADLPGSGGESKGREGGGVERCGELASLEGKEMIALLVWLAVVLWLLLVGFGVLQRSHVLEGCGAALSTTLALMAGLLVLHLVLQALWWLGIEWSPPVLWSVVGLMGASLAVLLYRGWVSSPESREVSTWSAWDWLSLASVLSFAVAAAGLRSTISDFVYHWGLKAHRFFEVQTLDLEYLARAENAYAHPDYPNLLPEVFAFSAILSGRFEPRVLLLWSSVFLALTVWLIRDALRARLESTAHASLATAAIACGLSAFSIGYYQAGGADWPFALGLLCGALLVERAHSASELAVGVCAAFVAATKIEGLPLALLLIGLFSLRRRRVLFSRPWSAVLARSGWLLGPTALVVGSWAFQVQRYGLLQPGNLAAPNLTNAREMAAGIWYSVTLQQWFGLPFLLILLPLLVLSRPSRWLAAIVGLQLSVYIALYLSTPLDTHFLVITSFPRLLLHLMPAFLLALFQWLAEPAQTGSSAAVT